MADTTITAAALDAGLAYRQTEKARFQKGTFVADDTDHHIMKVSFLGRMGITYGVDNPSDKDVVVTIYGAHTADAEVGDTGVFIIGAGITVTAGSVGFETKTDSFPYYLIRCKFAATPDGSAISVYADCKAL